MNSSLRIRRWLFAQNKTTTILGLGFLPWVAVVLITAGGWATLNLLGYATMVFAVGYGVIALSLPLQSRAEAFVFAPSIGILAISSLTAFWLRLGFPATGISAIWIGLMLIGVTFLRNDRTVWEKSTVSYGGVLVCLAALICVVYFLPGAQRDAVRRPDGSFNWMYVDTQFFYAISASIEGGESPPRMPGAANHELLYHFAPYAPAAIVSRVTGLGLGHAFARVTRGVSQWALMLSCLGLGTLLSRRGLGAKFGGIAVVCGLFFYGSLLSLFTDERNSSSYVHGAMLFKIPELGVLANGGPFSHLILGHSVLNGLVPITALLGICLMQVERKDIVTWRVLLLCALPALVVPVNSVAALYSVAVVGILLFWGRLRSVHSWLCIALILSFFFAAWKFMGFDHSPDVDPGPGAISLAEHITSQWWNLLVWFTIGLGFRIVGFHWISRPLRDPISTLVLATVVVLLSFFLFLRIEDGNEHYGIYYLQCMLSIFAFSRVPPQFWRGIERSALIAEWFSLARGFTTVLTACGVLLGIVVYLTHRHSGVNGFVIKLILSVTLVIAIWVGPLLLRRSPRLLTASSRLIAAVLLIGFLAWITPWINYGLGRMKMDVTLSPGEVKGLSRLSELAAPGELFATNRHAFNTWAAGNRSFGYTALAEHLVLLEGYIHGVQQLRGFNDLLRENDSMFTTTDPQMLRNTAKAWHVRWLVARPGTDIALSRPLPAWLMEQQNTGTLRIYRVEY